jgi:RNA polymerase sigma-70 factor, ECF subfamily
MVDLTHLLLRAQAGDANAFEQVVRAAQVDVQRYCTTAVNSTEAPDLAQEVFIRAWRSISTYEGTASGRAWLFGVARNTINDHIRRASRRRRIRSFVSLQGFSHTDANSDNSYVRVGSVADPANSDTASVLAIEGLIANLSDDRRDAFVLTQLFGFSYEEAADAAGVPIGTIRSRVARARGDLVQAMNAADRNGEEGKDNAAGARAAGGNAAGGSTAGGNMAGGDVTGSSTINGESDQRTRGEKLA